MLANTYGIAMPAKMDIECQILSKCVPDPRDPSPDLASRPTVPTTKKVGNSLAFPPAAFTSADLRPIAPPPILVTTGRDGSPAFPPPGSASRS